MDKRKKTVVGIDPGSTSAFAILDLKGKVLEVFSEKHMGSKEIIKRISDIGKPVLVATDKEKLPSSVEEIGRSFGSEIFTPEEDMSVHGKKEITRKHDYENLHERDALAAALNAYNSFKNKFRNIEARMDDLNLQELTPEVKESVVIGKAKNVSEAVETVLGGHEEDEDQDEEIKKEVETDLEEKIDNYRKMVIQERKDKKKLKEHNRKLKKKVEELEDEASKAKLEKNKAEEGIRKELMKDKEVKKLERNLRSKGKRIENLEGERRELENYIDRLKTFEELRKEGKVPVRELDELTEESLASEGRELSLHNSIIYTERLKGGEGSLIDTLKENGVEALITEMDDEQADEFVSKGIYVSSPDELELKERNGVKYIDGEDVGSIRKEDRESFIGWLKRYRDRDV